MSSSRSGAVRWVSCALVAGVTALVHGGMDTASAAASGRVRVPRPEVARALSLGFAPVVADYYWIQALQIAGEPDRSTLHRQPLGPLMDLVIGLDPWVDHPYRFAALWLTSSPEEVRHANRLLEKGIAYHPLDWRNRFYLGYNLFFYLEDNARAADALEGAIASPAAPDYLGPLVTRLRAASDSLETAALFLTQLIEQSQDELARFQYLQALDEIETERRARALDRARGEFQRRHGRDIRDPAELWSGPLRVLRAPPPAHPHLSAPRWQLDEESGDIVSSFYGSRYRLHFDPADEARRRGWRARLDAKSAGDSAAREGGA